MQLLPVDTVRRPGPLRNLTSHQKKCLRVLRSLLPTGGMRHWSPTPCERRGTMLCPVLPPVQLYSPRYEELHAKLKEMRFTVGPRHGASLDGSFVHRPLAVHTNVSRHRMVKSLGRRRSSTRTPLSPRQCFWPGWVVPPGRGLPIATGPRSQGQRNQRNKRTADMRHMSAQWFRGQPFVQNVPTGCGLQPPPAGRTYPQRLNSSIDPMTPPSAYRLQWLDNATDSSRPHISVTCV